MSRIFITGSTDGLGLAAADALDPRFQDRLVARLAELTGVPLF